MTKEEETIKHIRNLLKGREDKRGKTEMDIALETAIKAIEQQTKTAHWIDNHNGTISCSCCHVWFYKDDRYPYMRHCPYCNVKIVERKE